MCDGSQIVRSSVPHCKVACILDHLTLDSVSPQPAGRILGPIGQNDARPGPADGGQAFQRGGLFVEPARRAAALTMLNSPETL